MCTGALILAPAGLLEGRNATTHWSFSKQLERLGAHYVPDRKWVEDGKVISAAGITAGIDMALHLVGRLAGEAVARHVQLILEYDPQPPLGGIDWSQIDRDMLESTNGSTSAWRTSQIYSADFFPNRSVHDGSTRTSIHTSRGV